MWPYGHTLMAHNGSRKPYRRIGTAKTPNDTFQTALLGHLSSHKQTGADIRAEKVTGTCGTAINVAVTIVWYSITNAAAIAIAAAAAIAITTAANATPDVVPESTDCIGNIRLLARYSETHIFANYDQCRLCKWNAGMVSKQAHLFMATSSS